MKLLLSAILLASSTLSGADERPPAFIQDIVAIKIPKIEANEAELHELIGFISFKIVELDPRKPGGISFLTAGFGETEADDEGLLDSPKEAKKIKYSVEGARVDKVLTDLAEHFNVELHVASIGIVVTPSGGNPFPNAKADEGTVYYTYRKTSAEEGGADQSAIAPESKPEGKAKSRPKSEVRPK